MHFFILCRLFLLLFVLWLEGAKQQELTPPFSFFLRFAFNSTGCKTPDHKAEGYLLLVPFRFLLPICDVVFHKSFFEKIRRFGVLKSWTVYFAKRQEKTYFFAKKQEKRTSRMRIFVVVYNTSIKVIFVSTKRRTFRLFSKAGNVPFVYRLSPF